MDYRNQSLDNKVIKQTLGFLIAKDKVLLGKKKRGFFKGYVNGFGGKMINNETPTKCISREFQEETGIKIKNPRFHGLVNMTNNITKETNLIFIYKIFNYSGLPEETQEMTVEWHEINKIPIDKMWPSDKKWINLIFNEKRFVFVSTHYNNDKITEELYF